MKRVIYGCSAVLVLLSVPFVSVHSATDHTILEQRVQDTEFPNGNGFIIGQTFASPSPAFLTGIETLMRTGFAQCGGTVRMAIWRLSSSSGDVTQGGTLIAISPKVVDPTTFSFQQITFPFSEPIFIQASTFYFWGVYGNCNGPSVGASSSDRVPGNAWRVFGNIQDPNNFSTLTNLSLYQNLPEIVAIADFYEVISGETQRPLLWRTQQMRSDGITSLAEEEITPESTVLFRTRAFSAPGNQIQLQVELRTMFESFRSPTDPVAVGSDGGILLSGFVSSGSEVTITRGGLVAGPYHWQARVVDSQGNASDWQEFEEPRREDFIIGTPVPFSHPILVEHIQGENSVPLVRSLVVGQTFNPQTQGLIVSIDTKLLTGFVNCPGGVMMGLWRLNSASGDISKGGTLLAISGNTQFPNREPALFQFNFDHIFVDNSHYYFWGLFTDDTSCTCSIVAEPGDAVLGTGWMVTLSPDSAGFSTLTNASLYNNRMFTTGCDFYEVIRVEAPSQEADLGIAVNSIPDRVLVGSTITYKITLTNKGPNIAKSVTIEDILDANTSFE